jgi:hypothetical protein
MHECAFVASLTCLRSAGIDPVLGKGWAAARLYPEPGLRPYGDFDLCVPPGQYRAARATLAGAEALAASVDLHDGLRWRRDGQSFSLLDDRSLEELYARSEMVPLADVEVRILGAEDHLRLLCLHMLSHGVCRPLWLCDIGATLESLPTHFDWNWFLHGDPRRTAWAVHALGLAHQLLGARLDDLPVAERARRLPRWFAPAVLEQWGKGSRPRTPIGALVRRPAGAIRELRHHWPNGIEATINVRGPFIEWPRLPFQLGAAVSRTVQFLAAPRER